ncbi:hypothetical protein VZQ01_04550 [Myxococcus faecalis]|uniref:hypothetical protein n=1 Tax=Myxococcus TaxID=32 RepID=UPI001CBC50DF|nr:MULTISPECIES: hypothetical protein [unclassified Myxococcus]MBZ4397116.1 hypothetical protein [Myxococcus sp. AS-1-15]MBZ4408159.1 hypothetical protein [Myxococcus sp. XM-1-1-1]BDT33256.1 hypothetical protein MFMH1_29250 [Myxococcus sp. MH1]
MDPIRSRPRVVTSNPSTSLQPQAEARPTAAPARANAVGHTQLSSFETKLVAPAQAQAAQPTPGAWRGGPDTEVGKAVKAIWDRMQTMPGADVTIKGDTPASLLGRAILDGKKVTNEQIIAMSKVTLEQLATDPKDREKVLKKVPNARELPVHKFTVAMLSAATGIDPQKLSEACPDLGLTGAPGTPLLFAADGAGLQRSTALHDFTDYLRGAGIKGLNKAVWGVEGRILSAIVSAVGGGRY